MAELTSKQIAHIAHLSRLELSEAELEIYSAQLQSIMQYMEKLQEIDTSAVKPMYNPTPTINHVRADIPQKNSLTQEQALAMAPLQEDGRFSVPQIISED